MKELLQLRTLFMPVQPTVTHSADKVLYNEVLPSQALSGLVYCYWQLESLAPFTEPFCYRVVADGCIDVFVEKGKGHEQYVMGLSTNCTEFQLEQSFCYYGVRFLPAVFPLLFGVNAALLTNRVEALQDVLPAIAKEMAAYTEHNPGFNNWVAAVDGYLISKAAGAQLSLDHRVADALYHILASGGHLGIESSIKTGLSPRQLRRYFAHFVGESPKTFSKIVRFQRVLHTAGNALSLHNDKYFYDAGYYDQAHFIKEFKALYGSTPGQALP